MEDEETLFDDDVSAAEPTPGDSQSGWIDGL